MKKHIPLSYFLFAIFCSAFGQNVGIGTTSPTEKLHVTGNIKGDTVKPNAIKLSTNAGTGKVLTSDGTGNASWQASNVSAAGNIGFGVWGDCATNGNISEHNPVADPFGSAGDRLGYSVCISGNFAIVGAPFDDDVHLDQGSVSIFRYNGSNWEFMQKLVDPFAAVNDGFGISVSISGNFAIVGAAWDDDIHLDQGSVSIYEYNGTNWVFKQKLTDPLGGKTNVFGITVSISGNYAIAGAIFDDDIRIAQGSASIFEYNGSSWVFKQKLTDPNSSPDASFGSSVSISGSYAIVGASDEQIGTNTRQGSATIYRYNGSSWAPMQKLTNTNGSAYDNFGQNVSISTNYVIVGSTPGTRKGSVSIYIRVGNVWGSLQYITDPMGDPGDYFGGSTSLDGASKRFLIGSTFFANYAGKAVFGKIN